MVINIFNTTRPGIGLLVCFTLLAATQAHAGQTLFPRPQSLQPAIAFWTRVFTEIDSGAGFIHDNRHLAVVYETLEFKGFVNNGQMAVVMDEARAGIDFGEYPRPEGNRRLQRLRAREQRLPGMRLCGCQQRETDQEADARTCRIEDVDHHDCRSMPCPPCEGFYGACTGEICNYRSGQGCHRTGLWTASFREYLEASRPRARVQCAPIFSGDDR